jgi:hypothetical protein
MSSVKQELFLLHVLLFPSLLVKALRLRAVLSIPIQANPSLAFGGLPVAPKDGRQGSSEHFVETKRAGREMTVGERSVVKPVFGNRSRDVTVVEKNGRVPSVSEPMLIQPFVGGEEYALNIDRGGDVPVYSVTRINAPGEIWEGEATFRDVTEEAVSLELLDAVETVCEEAGLRFGRLDVKTRSIEALRNGDFAVLEVNGSLGLDMRLYTAASLTQKWLWLEEYWSRMCRSASNSVGEGVPSGSWRVALSFLVWPGSAHVLWDEVKDEYLASCS